MAYFAGEGIRRSSESSPVLSSTVQASQKLPPYKMVLTTLISVPWCSFMSRGSAEVWSRQLRIKNESNSNCSRIVLKPAEKKRKEEEEEEEEEEGREERGGHQLDSNICKMGTYCRQLEPKMCSLSLPCHPHTHTHSLTHSFTHSLARSLTTHPPTHTHTHTLTHTHLTYVHYSR